SLLTSEVTLELDTRGVEEGEEELRDRTTINHRVVSEQGELPSSVGLDFRARLDGGRMYSRHLEAMRLP
ncbi:hypothetical protein Tco_0156038, partial [Tanacetum coccineum]